MRQRSRHSMSSSTASGSSELRAVEAADASTSAGTSGALGVKPDGEKGGEKSEEYDPLFSNANLANGTHLSSCGHVMHAECWQRFFDAVVQRETRRRQRYVSSYDVEKNCFLCPMCESLCNAAVPVLPRWNVREEIDVIEKTHDDDCNNEDS